MVSCDRKIIDLLKIHGSLTYIFIASSQYTQNLCIHSKMTAQILCKLISCYRIWTHLHVHYPINRFLHCPKPVYYLEWVVPEKIHTSPTEKICAVRRKGVRKSLDLLQSFIHFLCVCVCGGGGGGMDIF